MDAGSPRGFISRTLLRDVTEKRLPGERPGVIEPTGKKGLGTISSKPRREFSQERRLREVTFPAPPKGTTGASWMVTNMVVTMGEEEGCPRQARLTFPEYTDPGVASAGICRPPHSEPTAPSSRPYWVFTNGTPNTSTPSRLIIVKAEEGMLGGVPTLVENALAT